MSRPYRNASVLPHLTRRIPPASTKTHFLPDADTTRGEGIANETAYGNKSATQEEKAAARKALCDKLDLAVLTVAIHHHGDEDKADLYFPQHLLENRPPQQPVP